MATKPPSFPFYGQDFQTGTMAMTPAERGVYVDCLWYQWASGGVPADDLKRLAQVMRCTPSDAKKYWTALASKFTRGDDGLYRNARLEVVRADKQKWHESRKNNGGKGGRPPKQETTAEPSGSENQNLVVPLSLSSVPTEQRDTRAERKRHGDPFGMKLDLNAAAHIFAGNEQIVSIPQGWATKAMREYGLSLPDVNTFAAWASGVVKREGFEDGGKRLAWLDGLLARWRSERSAPADRTLRPASEWIAEQDRIAAEIAAADAARVGPRLSVAELVADAKKRRAEHV